MERDGHVFRLNSASRFRHFSDDATDVREAQHQQQIGRRKPLADTLSLKFATII